MVRHRSARQDPCGKQGAKPDSRFSERQSLQISASTTALYGITARNVIPPRNRVARKGQAVISSRPTTAQDCRDTNLDLANWVARGWRPQFLSGVCHFTVPPDVKCQVSPTNGNRIVSLAAPRVAAQDANWKLWTWQIAAWSMQNLPATLPPINGESSSVIMVLGRTNRHLRRSSSRRSTEQLAPFRFQGGRHSRADYRSTFFDAISRSIQISDLGAMVSRACQPGRTSIVCNIRPSKASICLLPCERKFRR